MNILLMLNLNFILVTLKYFTIIQMYFLKRTLYKNIISTYSLYEVPWHLLIVLRKAKFELII